MKEIVEIEHTPGGLPLTHRFSDGIYIREIFMPKGMIVVGHVHNTKHMNIVLTGKAKVWDGESVKDITAPYTFESNSGIRKVLYIEEDMIWQTIHVTNETDIFELEEVLIDKSKSADIDKKFIDIAKTKLLGV